MVDVEISGIASLLQLGGDWQYLINLSPSHYPLYPQNYIKNILRQLPYGINLISHKRAECLKQRGEYLFLDRGLAGEHVDFSMNTGIQRPILDGYSYYKGSQWHVVTRQFCEYVVMSPDGLARRMLLYLAGYFVPDESYFQTVACNSEQFQNFTVDYDFHYVDWYNGQNVQPGKMWSPAIITNATLVQAYDSGAMFGRKFLIRDDKLGKTSIAAMDLIDQLFMEETLILGSNPESYKLSLEEKSKLVLSKLQAKINQTTMEQGCVQRWETC